jgi:hypothetical protein
VAVPDKLDGVVPSPQSTLIDETVPSGSVEAIPTVTADPVDAGFGATLLIVMVGGRSLMVSEVVPELAPAPLLAVIVIVNV